MQKIKKGDKIIVTVGKDRGKEGTVEHVLATQGKIVVPGINVYKRHVAKGRLNQNEGAIVEIVKPVKLDNVALVCPSCQKSTRVGFKIEGKNKLRICRKCKKEIK